MEETRTEAAVTDLDPRLAALPEAAQRHALALLAWLRAVEEDRIQDGDPRATV